MNVERISGVSERTIVLTAYLLHVLGAVVGVTSIIGLVLNYARRSRYEEPLDSHHRWMIRSFWWAVLWSLIGALMTFVLIGWAILAITWVWYVYRHVRGLAALANGEPMPD